MSTFDEDIRKSNQHDHDSLKASYVDLASVVMGDSAFAQAINTDEEQSRDAVTQILAYYGHEAKWPTDEGLSMDEQIEYVLRPYGIMTRWVKLEKDWYRNCCGAMLGTRTSGEMVALLPTAFGRYRISDRKKGVTQKVRSGQAKLVHDEALLFYRALPQKKVTAKTFFSFLMSLISPGTIFYIVLLAMLVTVLGLLTPVATNMLFSQIIPNGSSSRLIGLMMMLLGVTVSTALLSIIRKIYTYRIQGQMTMPLMGALMARTLSLDTQFFKKYSSGDIANRISKVTQFCLNSVSAVLVVGLSTIMGLLYFTQIAAYTPSLVLPCVGILVVIVGFQLVVAFVQAKVTSKTVTLEASLSGMLNSVFSGVSKLKTTGSERRVFAKWEDTYHDDAELTYAPPMILRVQSAVTSALVLLGTLVIFFAAAQTSVSASAYMTFNTAYGVISGLLLNLPSIVPTLAEIVPVYRLIEPILEAPLEQTDNRKNITDISGAFEMSNVSFAYDLQDKPVLRDISFKVEQGQYVGIVGKTGCGKSTLMRLLLGFETPQDGQIYYDDLDLDTINLKAFRKNIGCVMQNGKLFAGDIFSNISISAPWITEDEAWEAAEAAALADDIRKMPMGMHTYISEGSETISGGQKQRLMIARAIAGKPRILFFDEATSALDNVTQKQISDALDGMDCTRIVIAHRLSTIENCDRIITIADGGIAEDGTYESLMQADGVFADLVSRQQVDDLA